jgi:hypothetical protein
VVALIGLGYLDRSWPRLRNFSLLWVTPISIYAIFYNTWDSAVYLLPVVWMFALWLAAGIAVSMEWLQTRWRSSTLSSSYAIGAVSVAFVIILAIVRWPDLALRYDNDARRFVQGTLEAIEPGAILVSSSDAETFALWYATWGSGELMEKAPGTVLVNPALYQFAWYRRLLRDVYPQIPGIDTSFAELLAANDILRPIYFAEELTDVPAGHLEPAGTLWRYVAKR